MSRGTLPRDLDARGSRSVGLSCVPGLSADLHKSTAPATPAKAVFQGTAAVAARWSPGTTSATGVLPGRWSCPASRGRFARARTELCHGERLRRAGRRVDARVQLHGALETFERLGARPWAGCAAGELCAAGQRIARRDLDAVRRVIAALCDAEGHLLGGFLSAAARFFGGGWWAGRLRWMAVQSDQMTRSVRWRDCRLSGRVRLSGRWMPGGVGGRRCAWRLRGGRAVGAAAAAG